MGLLPSDPDVSPETAPRVVGVDSDDADALMSALSSETARRILSTLHEDPAPPSKVADRVDTSLQNTQYHLERLEDAGAVEVAGTAYSEKGREMDVYAPADSPLVIFAGREEESSGLRAALSRLVGSVGVLALGSVVVQEVYGEGFLPRFGASSAGGGPSDGGDAGAGATPTASGQAANLSGTRTGTPAADAGAGTGTPHPATVNAGGSAGTPTAAPTDASTGQPTTTSGDVGIFGAETSTPTPQPSATSVATDSVTAARTSTEAATGTPTAAPTAARTSTETAAGAAQPTPTPTPGANATDVAQTTAEAATGLDLGALPPGALFFLGGLVVLAVAVAFTSTR